MNETSEPHNSPDHESTEERTRRIRERNRVILMILLALVVLFYAITVVRISGG